MKDKFKTFNVTIRSISTGETDTLKVRHYRADVDKENILIKEVFKDIFNDDTEIISIVPVKQIVQIEVMPYCPN